MTYLPNRPEEAFENLKDDERVQAILTALGKLRERVSMWSLDNKNRYTIVFEDESEMRGEVMWVWQHKGWIASSSLVPKEVAQAERDARAQQKQGA